LVETLEREAEKRDDEIHLLQAGEEAALQRADDALARVDAAIRDAQEAEEAELRKTLELQALRRELGSDLHVLSYSHDRIVCNICNDALSP
jgi:hypothetical protein